MRRRANGIAIAVAWAAPRTLAEVVLRMLVLKHVRNWSYDTLEREVRARKMVQIQEAENQIITHYEVFSARPDDSDLLVPAVEVHQNQFGRAPALVAADAAFYSQGNERTVEQMGVKWVSVPNRRSRSPERRQFQKRRWFKKGSGGEPAAKGGSAC